MERLRKSLILLFVAGIPAAAPPLHSTPPLCFSAGPLTYQISPVATRSDLRVHVADGPAQADLHIQLVDRAESADFVLADDEQAPNSGACNAGGAVTSVALVPERGSPDITISLTRATGVADFTLFVHSARMSEAQAAALFLAMRQSGAQQANAAR